MILIAPHWTHERLAENLRTASHAQTLNAAAMEWVAHDVGDIRNVRDARARQEIRCQLCNHRILRYTVIRNVVNEMLLITGLDCLGKLIAFLAWGRIEAPLRDGASNRKRFHTLLTALRRDVIGDDATRSALLSNKTVLGWFEAEHDAGHLPEGIARLVRLMHLDMFPAPADAERLVEHYRQHRLMPIEALVPARQLRVLARFRRRLPAMITIAAVPRILRLADRMTRIAASYVEHDRPMSARLRLTAAVAGLDDLLVQLRREIPGSDWYLQADVEKLRSEITAAESQPPSSLHEHLLRRVEEWERVVQHQLESPTVHVYVDPRIVPVIFSREDDGSWQHRRWLLRAEQRPTRAGVYTARLVSSNDLFALTEAPGQEPQSVIVTLDVALDRSPFHGKFRGHGGRDGDRWIIPVPQPLWRPGTYRCLMLQEHPDQIFVYPIARARVRKQATAS